MKHFAAILALVATLLAWQTAMAANSPEPVLMPPPTADELARTAEINAWLDAKRAAQEASRVRDRWVSAAVFLALAAGFVTLVWRTWRSERPPVFKRSRVVLWAPCFLLASAWWFPPSLLAAIALAPALLWVWWTRALSWRELCTASALYVCAAGGLWTVFSVLAGLANQGAGK
ncbi:hypothetical protein [Acidovorax sp. sic0104]|uniref:hypothetical protein n=1 Tax=Acidovorax sp. sic0104 TaxID=2854784 RepID=UPI001C442257|nr:hypothetical protein [Acidovorax sp. sic0104]MBV7543855.1 hypothetical protein [Acidovorax sp. sic0104]